MKQLCSIFVGITLVTSTNQIAATEYPDVYAKLLQTYVGPEGVKYAQWHANEQDMEAIREVVEFYGTTKPPEDKAASLAWHLNAYNAWILHNILRKYPTDGPLAGEAFFFHGNRIRVSGQRTSFDNLEQKLIRPVFNEPRIHFALNCAAESCPPLWNQPFRAATLDADLEMLTLAFINNHPEGVVVAPDGRVQLSKIFEWYAEDFGGKDNLLAYVNQYRNQNIPIDARVEILEYSWSLNETP
ncbi:MAG: DUF547 domain-containing protein [Verrucomicrobiales bacterium]